MKTLSPISPIHHHMSGGSNGVLLVKFQMKDILNIQDILSFIHVHIDGCTFINPAFTGTVNCNIAIMTDKNDLIPYHHIKKLMQHIQDYISYHHRIHLNLKYIEYDSTAPLNEVIDFISPQVMSIFDSNVHSNIHPNMYFGMPVSVAAKPGSKPAPEEKIQKNEGAFKLSSKLEHTGAIRTKLHTTAVVSSDNGIDKFIFSSTLENNAAVRVNVMVDLFSTKMKKKLETLFPLRRSISNVKLPSDNDLIELVKECNLPLQDFSNDKYDKSYLNTKAFYLGSIQLRMHIHNMLLPYYKTGTEKLKLNFVKNFEDKLRKIPGRAKAFPRLQRKLANEMKSQFRTQMKALRKGMSFMSRCDYVS